MTRLRHVPIRRCVVCRTERPKRDLLRLVQGAEGWSLDLRQRAGGRGTSLCPTCALSAVRGTDPAAVKRLRRAFQHEAERVIALLAEIETVLAAPQGANDPTGPTLPARAAESHAPTPPNGGMHG